MLYSLARFVRDNGALWLIKLINRGLRGITSFTHHIQMLMEFGIRPNTEWFDHFMDQHYQWTKTRIPLPWERGVFNMLVMKQGARVLDICCGDGFNAHHFYSIRAAHVHSVDFDHSAIAHARKHFRAPNVTYEVCDIRNGLPHRAFDHVVWDGAIEHFTETEIAAILTEVRRRLPADGMLSGHTIVKNRGGKKQHHEHEYEFESKEDLARFLTPHFKNVLVYQNVYPTRTNLYFFATNGPLPFEGHDTFRSCNDQTP